VKDFIRLLDEYMEAVQAYIIRTSYYDVMLMNTTNTEDIDYYHNQKSELVSAKGRKLKELNKFFDSATHVPDRIRLDVFLDIIADDKSQVRKLLNVG